MLRMLTGCPLPLKVLPGLEPAADPQKTAAQLGKTRRDRLLVGKVRQTLAEHPAKSRNADDLAAWLNLSPRTLHRQLKEEGASLQALKDSVRRDTAVDLLLRTTRPIKQIAAEAGFQNEKSFMRAFKGWTGSTPEAFRHNV
jgi:AraC-like DNA-binding protein